MASDQKPGIALLSLDGGRWETHGALTQIHIVEDIIDQYEFENDLEAGSVKVSDIFDYVIGTGTGGLVACMLGPLGMSTADAKEAYIRLWDSNFSTQNQSSERTETLKCALKSLLDAHTEGADHLLSEMKMINVGKLTPSCKFALTATTAANRSKPVLLRAYRGRGSSIQCTLLEALLATLSDGQMLPPISIGVGISERLLATTNRYCNPVEALFEEIPVIFNSRFISAIVSVGSGHPTTVPLHGGEDFAIDVIDLSRSCHELSESAAAQFLDNPNIFTRFDVNGFDLSRTIQPGDLISHTRSYLAQDDIRRLLDSLIRSLIQRPSHVEACIITTFKSRIANSLDNHSEPVSTVTDSRLVEQPFASSSSALTPVSVDNIHQSPTAPKPRTTQPATPRVSLSQPPYEEGNDIRSYLHANLSLEPSRINDLVIQADGLFIYASTLVKYLSPRHSIAPAELKRRLEAILSGKAERSGIRTLYKQIIDTALSSDDKEVARNRWLILHTIICCTAESPSVPIVAGLLGVDPQLVTTVVESLYSVLYTTATDGSIWLYDASFRDFVASSTGGKFPYNAPSIHTILAQACVAELAKSLRFNICRLESSFIPDAVVQPPLEERVAKHIGAFLVYASENWWVHTKRCDEVGKLYVLPIVEQMLRDKAIFWIEVMSLLGDMQRCKEILNQLMSASIILQKAPSIHLIASDALKLVSLFDAIPEKMTCHLYLSCLALSEETPNLNRWRAQFQCFPRVISRQRDLMQNPRQIIGPETPLTPAAISLPRKRIVSASHDNTVLIWDAESGQKIRELEGHTEWVYSAAFSPTGKHVVTGSRDVTIRIWDADSGEEIWKVRGHKGWVLAVAFSPDGTRIVSGSQDRTVRIWDAESGEMLQQLNEHTDAVRCIAFSPGGTRIVSGSNDQTIYIWDVKLGTKLRQLNGHTGYVASVAFSPHGQRVVSGSNDRTVRIWDAKSGKQLRQLNNNTSSIWSAAFSPDGKHIVSGSGANTIHILDVESGKELRRLAGHTGYVRSVAYSSDGRFIVSGSHDKTVRIWDAESGEELRQLKEHTNCVNSVAFSPTQRPTATSSSDLPRYVDPSKEICRPTSHISHVWSVIFSPDGKQIVFGSDDSIISIWDAVSGKEVQQLKGHTGRVWSVAISLDGKHIVSGSNDSTVRIWDADSGKERRQLLGHTSSVLSVIFSPDMKHIVSGSGDNTIRIWDAELGNTIRQLYGHASYVQSIGFSPAGRRIVSGSGDETICIWNAESGRMVQQLSGHAGCVRSVAFSPDGKSVISGSEDCTVRIWDAESGTLLHQLNGHTAYVHSVAYSPDGTRIASASSDATVRIWDAMSGQELWQINGHTAHVWSVAFSPDGKRIVSGSHDKTIRIWDSQAGKLPLSLNRHMEQVRSVAFSRDNQRATRPRFPSSSEVSILLAQFQAPNF
ncbi:WD40-repeat-containing domain protein [Flagelloscypha sp. PMI_526]|nr:WD40-repeat-containing domain protein [Flagelloscypha sp. PMI_526]